MSTSGQRSRRGGGRSDGRRRRYLNTTPEARAQGSRGSRGELDAPAAARQSYDVAHPAGDVIGHPPLIPDHLAAAAVNGFDEAVPTVPVDVRDTPGPATQEQNSGPSTSSVRMSVPDGSDLVAAGEDEKLWGAVNTAVRSEK